MFYNGHTCANRHLREGGLGKRKYPPSRCWAERAGQSCFRTRAGWWGVGVWPRAGGSWEKGGYVKGRGTQWSRTGLQSRRARRASATPLGMGRGHQRLDSVRGHWIRGLGGWGTRGEKGLRRHRVTGPTHREGWAPEKFTLGWGRGLDASFPPTPSLEGAPRGGSFFFHIFHANFKSSASHITWHNCPATCWSHYSIAACSSPNLRSRPRLLHTPSQCGCPYATQEENRGQGLGIVGGKSSAFVHIGRCRPWETRARVMLPRSIPPTLLPHAYNHSDHAIVTRTYPTQQPHTHVGNRETRTKQEKR